MNIHEYQAKKVLSSFGVAVPRGRLVEEGGSVGANAEKAAKDLQSECQNSVWVVKAQIHAGGRGKAGGVRLCKSVEEVRKAAEEMHSE